MILILDEGLVTRIYAEVVGIRSSEMRGQKIYEGSFTLKTANRVHALSFDFFICTQPKSRTAVSISYNGSTILSTNKLEINRQGLTPIQFLTCSGLIPAFNHVIDGSQIKQAGNTSSCKFGERHITFKISTFICHVALREFEEKFLKPAVTRG